MKAIFLVFAFGLVAVGLRCPADTCHDEFGHDEHATQTAGHPTNDCCDCLGCHPATVIDAPSSDAPAPDCAPAGIVAPACPMGPRLVYSDGPFHPPRA